MPKKLKAASEAGGQAGERTGTPFEALSPPDQVFALTYLQNGFNATRAYLKAFPKASYQTAMVGGHWKLRKPKIRAFLNTQLEETWKPLQMGGEEALGRVALLAGGSKDERVKLAALKVILEQSGKLRGVADSVDALAAAIRQDKTEAREKGL